jgi:ABC-type antimicrobial peptide transport system permease subunit
VPAVKQASLSEDPNKETIYWHYKHEMERGGMLVVRTTLTPEQITRTASAAVLGIDRDVPLSDVMTLDARVAGSLGPQRTPMVLTLVFAGVASMLAVIGIYGVLTWAVTERRGEIGVRMALGARAADIVRMVIGQGGRLTLIGLTGGLLIALALGRVLASQIYEVSPADPAVLGIAILALVIAATIASWLPARRAARIDPMRALRDE